MSLRNLTGLDQEEIVGEYKNLMSKIIDFVDILSKPERVTQIIREELADIKPISAMNAAGNQSFGGDIADEDLIPQREMVVTLTHGGYIKPADHRLSGSTSRLRQTGSGNKRRRLYRNPVCCQHA